MAVFGVAGLGGMTAVWPQMQYPYARGAIAAASAVSRPNDAAAVSTAFSQPNGVSDAASASAVAQPERTSAVGTAAAAVGAAAATDAAFPTSELPYIPNGYGPEELATRTRVQFPDFGTPLSNALEGKLAGLENEEEQENIPGIEDPESPAEVMDDAKCETCEKRKYQDGSDDPGVSFKNAQHVDPKLAPSAVRGHEMEHVVRERLKAQQEGRKVVSQSVTYHTGICPECGKFYVSGGTTRTVTAEDNSSDYLDKLFGLDDDGFDITA